MSLSVREQLHAGSSILLTGGLGFLGGVCLEQLLRLTEAKVYLLVRGKRTASAAERVEKMLCGPLFSLLHEQAASGVRQVFDRVHVVDGDLGLPGMGLQPCDRQLLVECIDTVIHCAANLTLDAAIQDTLKDNYFGTKHLLQLAAEMHHLRSFVFTSTYWVNNFKPYNTPVKEEVHYPTLQLAGHTSPVSCAELVELLMSMPPAEANQEASTLMARLNFTSTYAFGKLLAEMMFDDARVLPAGVGKAIVRPSLITGVAGAPYPGYFTGFAGCQGYCLGYGIGFFHAQSSFAFSSDNILDLIPADTTAALLIAAASCAAASGPLPSGQARVYHAASASSHPRSIVAHLSLLRDFWVANPPPFCLPFTRYPIISGRHVPTEWGLALQRHITYGKVWLASKLLQLSGRSRYARSLLTSFRAFCVQNTIGYARSIISRVDNALVLRDSIVAEERGDWPCVWQQGSSPDWVEYGGMILTGMRCLGFKLPAEDVTTPVPHNFRVMQGLADPRLMHTWRQPQAEPLHTADSGTTAATSDISRSTSLTDSISRSSSGEVDSEINSTSSEHTGPVKRPAAGKDGVRPAANIVVVKA